MSDKNIFSKWTQQIVCDAISEAKKHNYYTSMDLATKFLQKSMNILGSLQSNRKETPKCNKQETK